MLTSAYTNLARFIREYSKRPEQNFIIFQACLASFFIFLFAMYRVVQSDWVLAVIDLLIVVALAGLVCFAVKDLYFRAVSLCFIAVVLLGSWATIWIGGTDNVYWSYPVVLMMFYVLRIKEALCTSLISMVVLIGIYLVKDASPTAFAVCYMLVILYSFQFAYMMKTDNERLTQEVALDPLTGVGNRRALDDAMLEAIEALSAQGARQSLILVDIDFFKRINDDFGHDVGDICLRRAADTIKGVLPEGASLYRFGGEEFSVLLKAGLEPAMALSEQIRLKVEQAPLIRERVVTVSIGVAELRSSDDAREWFHHADELLYQAKHQGRNIVCAHKVNIEAQQVELNLGEGI